MENNTKKIHPGSGRRNALTFNKGRQSDDQSINEIKSLIPADYLRQRDMLIECLHLIQDNYKCLKPKYLAALAELTNLPLTEIYEVASFYAHFDIFKDDDIAPAEITIRVCDSITCEMNGCQSLQKELESNYSTNENIRVVRAPCMGRCHQAPVVEVGKKHITNANVEKIKTSIDNKDIKPLNESKIVSYRNYEHEFYKKLWLLNGLHLKLAYFGLSREIKYIHEILNNQEGLEFAKKSIDSLSKAYRLFSDSNEDLDDFKQTILNRFSLPEIQDEVIRIARNPEIKFSKDERFERPLRLLISANEQVETFKEVLDIVFENNFEDVDGFTEFKKSQLSNDKSYFYNEFWKVDNYSDKYIQALGN